MSAELVAQFEKRFHRGPTISFAMQRPAEGHAVTVLFGPSGSGKSTVLRALAGLDRPESGSIRFAGDDWLDAPAPRLRLPAAPRRRVPLPGLRLFPHLSVAQNIAYPLKRTPRNTRVGIVGSLLERFGLEGLGDRYPRQLSGGQQQRAALARVLGAEAATPPPRRAPLRPRRADARRDAPAAWANCSGSWRSPPSSSRTTPARLSRSASTW